MNNLYRYHVNIIMILAGLAALVYTAAGFDGAVITWGLRIIGLAFIVDGVTLPVAVNTDK